MSVSVSVICNGQDVREYFEHLLELLAKAEKAVGSRGAAAAMAEAMGVPLPGAGARAAVAGLFAFETESRVRCGESGAVAYARDRNNVLGAFF